MSTAEVPRLDRLVELVDLVAHDHDLYVRFSRQPANEHGGSVDYESGLPLPGFSVNRLTPQPWWTRPLEDWVARQVCQYLHLIERSPDHTGWVVRGTVAGHGPDDEPLLRDVDPVACLTTRLLTEAQHVYEQRFTPGKVHGE